MESFLSGRNALASSNRTDVTPQKAPSNFQALFTRSVDVPASQLSGEPTIETALCDTTREPQLELIQGQNGIERIVVICGCGKRIEIQCQYA